MLPPHEDSDDGSHRQKPRHRHWARGVFAVRSPGRGGYGRLPPQLAGFYKAEVLSKCIPAMLGRKFQVKVILIAGGFLNLLVNLLVMVFNILKLRKGI